jgi:hypothetical protein
MKSGKRRTHYERGIRDGVTVKFRPAGLSPAREIRQRAAIRDRKTTREEIVSHMVTVKTQVRDSQAIHGACLRLGLAVPEQGEHQLYSSKATGLAVKLPEWIYPVVCDTQTGELKFDNYGGEWGEQKQLDRFLQAYAVEKAKIEARRKGHTCTEISQADGSIKLQIRGM